MPMCVGVVVGVWGNGIERRPPFSRPPICRPPFVCVVGAARLSRPPSAEIVGDGGRESQVEQMIIVAKEAGQWRWVIVAHLEWSISVCQSVLKVEVRNFMFRTWVWNFVFHTWCS